MSPIKPKHPCNAAGCNQLTNDRFCDVHRGEVDRWRGTPAERGYTKQWAKVRMIKLRHQPLCERCEEQGRVKSAVIVHHIKPISEGGAVLDMGNLMSVCTTCHGVLHGDPGGM